MINLTATTILTSDETAERALAYFVHEAGLRLIEISGHCHGREGSLEVTVSGDPLVGREKYEPLDLLRAVLRDMRDRYGFSMAQVLLHFHTEPDETAGHMMLQIDAGAPGEVGIESEGLDRLSREFLDGLPRPQSR